MIIYVYGACVLAYNTLTVTMYIARMHTHALPRARRAPHTRAVGLPGAAARLFLCVRTHTHSTAGPWRAPPPTWHAAERLRYDNAILALSLSLSLSAYIHDIT